MDCFKPVQPKPQPKPQTPPDPNPVPTPPYVEPKKSNFSWVWTIVVVIAVVVILNLIDDGNTKSNPSAHQIEKRENTISTQQGYQGQQTTTSNNAKENTSIKNTVNHKSTELKVLLDKYNNDIANGYSGDWNLLKDVNGVSRISEMVSGIAMPNVINYSGVLYFDNQPITDDFDKPQRWSLRLEGPRAGAYLVEADCDMLGYFEDDIDRYLTKIGCHTQKKVNLPFGWYKIYKYKNVYVGLYAGSSGNHGNNIGILFIQEKNYIPDAEKYMSMQAQ